MAYQIEYAYTCHMGKVRGNNEDNFWCCGETLPADNQGIEGVHTGIISGSRTPALAVFDGMGGESCGEIAAFLASKEFGLYYEKNKRSIKNDPENFIDGICKSMNQAVCSYGKENRINSMGTTVAMALFTPDSVFICNIGDSRVYLLDEEGFYQVSTDHVLGKCAFGKAPLTQYLGIEEEHQVPDPSVVEVDYKIGNKYLLCSDGITDMLSNSEIADILVREAPLGEIVEILLERVLEKGGRDNITIVLCEIRQREYKDRIKKWLNGFRKESEG